MTADLLLLQVTGPAPAGALEILWRETGVVPVAAGAVIVALALIALGRLLSARRALARAQRADRIFSGALGGSAHVLGIYQDERTFPQSPRWGVYAAGCRELGFFLLGTDVVDGSFAARLRSAGRITPSQLNAVVRAMQCRAASTIIGRDDLAAGPFASGAALPWFGVLGALAVFVDGAVRAGGGMPEVSRLIPPAFALVALALLLMLGLRLVARSHARNLARDSARLRIFPHELAGLTERSFVDHHQGPHEPVSLDGLGAHEFPGFNLPPPEESPRAARA